MSFWCSIQRLSETVPILKRIEWDIIINIQWSSVKYLLFLLDFNETWMFSTQFWEILKYQILCKSVQGEPSCSMWTGRHGEAVDALCSFANMSVRLAYIEVYTEHYFLEDLCKHSSFFKTGHPWNKGQISGFFFFFFFLRTSEPR